MTYVLTLVFSIIVPSSIAYAAAVLYASINPPTPSFVPPKYRTTTTSTFVREFDLSTPRIGGPAVFDGSPSSFVLYLDAS